MEYYFTEDKNVDTINSLLIVEGFEYNHLVRVLRKKIDDLITITDGKRNIYRCKIVEITKDEIICKILSQDYNLYESELQIHLFVSVLRNNDRFEFLIEKVVELGVFEIHPVISKYSIINSRFSETKMNRLRKIIVSAMGQSQRCYLPLLNNTISFEDMLNITENKIRKVVYYEQAEAVNEKFKGEDFDAANDLCILIGPEGGFDKDEINKLSSSNWVIESLGDRKVRAETAAIISIFEQINKYKFKGKDIL